MGVVVSTIRAIGNRNIYSILLFCFLLSFILFFIYNQVFIIDFYIALCYNS